MTKEKGQNPYLSSVLTSDDFLWNRIMETAGVEPASRNSNTSASTRVVCLFTIHVTLCRQTGVLYANLEISCRWLRWHHRPYPTKVGPHVLYMGDREAERL